MQPIPILLFLATAVALPAGIVNERAAIPTVRITNGTVIGLRVGTVENFKGIPYAQPPTGALRLKPPQPLSRGFGVFTSQLVPNSCPQFLTQIDRSNLPSAVISTLVNSPLLQESSKQSEDCLTVNVQRPAGTTSSSKLPVVVWFFGGAFEFGSTQLYDATSLIITSITAGKPILYVAVNYRVGGFGFLAGKEVKADGSTNLGLRDQRLALQWVQDNIAAFGGDPSRVTLWGESAGSISAFDHTVINGGDNSYKGSNLFQAVIMDSGSIVPTLSVDDPKAQGIYDSVVSAAGCSSAPDTLACLRALSFTTLQSAMNSVPGTFGYRSVDLSYLPRPDPSNTFFATSPDVAVKNGAFSKVPIIIGDQEDEGTLFSLAQTNITTTAQLTQYISSFFPEATDAQIASLVATYPDDPAAGSPFNSGDLNEIYPQYKRLAAILGDLTFTLTRRTYLFAVSSQVPSWSYLSSYLSGTPILGTFHASDILEAYYNLPSATAAASIQTFYISFINSLDPNSIPQLLPWPVYDTSTPSLFNFQAAANRIIPDTFRQSSFQALLATSSSLKI